METTLLTDILLQPFAKETTMSEKPNPLLDLTAIEPYDPESPLFLADVSRGRGQLARVRPLRVNDSPTTARPFDEGYALWSAIEALEHLKSLAGKRMNMLRPSSEAVLAAAKEILTMEFQSVPDPKKDAAEPF